MMIIQRPSRMRERWRRHLLSAAVGALSLTAVSADAARAIEVSASGASGPSSQDRSLKEAAMTPLEHAASRRLIREGLDIIYSVQGTGPSIVLIPSLGRGAEDFDLLAAGLAADGFRVIRPEPRGFGGSTPLRDGETLHDMARDIAAVIEAERAGPVIVAGHAAGNWTARVLAFDRPDLVRAVALLAAIVTGEAPRDIRASISGSFDFSLPVSERLKHLTRAYFAPGADASVWLEGWRPDVASAQRAAARATRDTAWIRVADVYPTLYLGAAQDVISPPPSLEALREVIGPKAQLSVVADAGHALLPEQPEATLAALRAWIADLPPEK